MSAITARTEIEDLIRRLRAAGIPYIEIASELYGAGSAMIGVAYGTDGMRQASIESIAAIAQVKAGGSGTA